MCNYYVKVEKKDEHFSDHLYIHCFKKKIREGIGTLFSFAKKKKNQGRYSDWWVAFLSPVIQRPPGCIRVVAPHFPRAIACIQLVQDERTGRTCISSSSLCLAESHITYNHSLGVN